jgi:hypothetical protein
MADSKQVREQLRIKGLMSGGGRSVAAIADVIGEDCPTPRDTILENLRHLTG